MQTLGEKWKIELLYNLLQPKIPKELWRLGPSREIVEDPKYHEKMHLRSDARYALIS